MLGSEGHAILGASSRGGAGTPNSSRAQGMLGSCGAVAGSGMGMGGSGMGMGGSGMGMVDVRWVNVKPTKGARRAYV